MIRSVNEFIRKYLPNYEKEVKMLKERVRDWKNWPWKWKTTGDGQRDN